MMRFKLRMYQIVTVCLIFVCGLLIGKNSTAHRQKPTVEPPQNVRDFSTASHRVRNSVVGIVVTGMEVIRRGYYYDYFRNRFFRRDYRQYMDDVENMGSGIIIDSSGYVLTSYHVVKWARDLTISLSDGNTYEGELVGVDSLSDLAVVKIQSDEEGFKPARFSDSDSLKVGQWALALGNPFLNFFKKSDPTVTVGVISALNRNFRQSESSFYQDMIQTDAAINPGNSGGPLINDHGDVIGVNAFIYTGEDDSHSGGSIGIGFAIPSNRALNVARELIEYGKRRYVYTGMILYDARDDADLEPGVYIKYIAPMGPAAEAGLKIGDRINAVDGRRIHSPRDLRGVLVPYFPGDTISISVLRDEAIQNFPLVLGNM